MKEILTDQNPHWTGSYYDGFISRAVLPELLSLLSLDEMLVLKGVRRCGKTTLFLQIINHLMDQIDPKKILYVNLDDPFFTTINEDPKNLYKIVETAETLIGNRIQYLFLAETNPLSTK